MSRLKNYIDRDEQEQSAELHILYDKAVSVDVHRRQATQNTGFEEEVGTASYLKTINVRLDATPDDRPKFTHLGLTDDLDVQLNDRWHYTTPAGIEVRLRVMDKQLNNRTMMVRLKEDGSA